MRAHGHVSNDPILRRIHHCRKDIITRLLLRQAIEFILELYKKCYTLKSSPYTSKNYLKSLEKFCKIYFATLVEASSVLKIRRKSRPCAKRIVHERFFARGALILSYLSFFLSFFFCKL